MYIEKSEYLLWGFIGHLAKFFCISYRFLYISIFYRLLYLKYFLPLSIYA